MTALDLITAAFRLIGVTSQGNALGSEDAQNGLQALQMMLERWSAETPALSAISRLSTTLTANKADYTIGSGADIDTDRPTRIEGAFVRDANGNDYQLYRLDPAQYRSITAKSNTSSRPEYFWYNPEYPNGKLFLWPVPDSGGETLFLDLLQPLQSFTSLTDAVNLPPEYQSAIKFHLAIELAPEYGIMPNKVVALQAKAAYDKVIAINAAHRHQSARMEFTPGGRYNIYTDV